MDTSPLTFMSRDMTDRFIDLIGSLSSLRELIDIQVAAIDETSLIRDALKALMKNQDMDSCSVFLLRDGYLINTTGLDWEDMVAEPRAPGKVFNSRRFKLGQGIIGLAAQTRSLQHCRSCTEDPRFEIEDPATSRSVPGCLISAPIELGGELLGVLNISHPQPHYFDEWHERLLLIYCGILAQLLVSNRMFHHLEGEIRHRTTQLEQALEEANLLKGQFELLSHRDDLTGLHNRRYFFPEANAALSRAVRYKQPLSLLLIDLDLFKKINDLYGHAVGDAVLQAVAGILSAEVRSGDILARLGGEEFGIVAPLSDPTSSKAFAERVRQRIKSQPIRIKNETLPVTASVGIANLEKDSAGIETWRIDHLLARADQALYEAKRLGRDRVIAYDDMVSATAAE